jgi:hypothetical protein
MPNIRSGPIRTTKTPGRENFPVKADRQKSDACSMAMQCTIFYGQGREIIDSASFPKLELKEAMSNSFAHAFKVRGGRSATLKVLEVYPYG